MLNGHVFTMSAPSPRRPVEKKSKKEMSEYDKVNGAFTGIYARKVLEHFDEIALIAVDDPSKRLIL